MNAAAVAKSEVEAEAMEEEAEDMLQRVSPVERIAMSLGLVVSLVIFSPQLALEPGIAAFGVVVGSAAAFCWDVYGLPLLRAAILHSEVAVGLVSRLSTALAILSG